MKVSHRALHVGIYSNTDIAVQQNVHVYKYPSWSMHQWSQAHQIFYRKLQGLTLEFATISFNYHWFTCALHRAFVAALPLERILAKQEQYIASASCNEKWRFTQVITTGKTLCWCTSSVPSDVLQGWPKLVANTISYNGQRIWRDWRGYRCLRMMNLCMAPPVEW